jgi:hypothetical protein
MVLHIFVDVFPNILFEILHMSLALMFMYCRYKYLSRTTNILLGVQKVSSGF